MRLFRSGVNSVVVTSIYHSQFTIHHLYLAGVLIVLASSRPSVRSTLMVWKSLVQAKQHARFWWVRVLGLAIALAGMVLLMRMEETTGLEEILIMFVLLYLFYEHIAGVSTSDLTHDQQTRDKG